ncbi:alpha/beta hydrolase [Nocardioides okcheonensis]|uniref:alpha/beta hydrolase n=1 Tax=Nocardioides okcheonensis TaxID=2894081 RepID=UPI001E2E537A|nr:alpha/beta hydrolase [Nocardioides okcheonensis]UFN44528.1 alpha/beta hydrolase family protein [Nocardioides okcheonensis]
MTTIQVPAPIPEWPEPDVRPSAAAVATDLRAAAVATSDVTSWMSAHGVPAGWTGNAADAAGHAMTAMGRRADAAVAALEKAVTAVEAYLDQMATRRAELDRLDDERVAFNRDRESLWSRADGAPADQADALLDEAAALLRRHDRIVADREAWLERVRADEDRVIAVLASLDTTSEGRDARDDSTRVDVDGLRRQLASQADPRSVNDWWLSLTDAQRAALAIAFPELVGNTNGIPTGDRDEANRATIDRDEEYLRQRQADGSLTDQERAWLERVVATRDALALGELAGTPVDTNLMVYLPHAFDGDGAAAVSYGDPDTADDTAVIVPGLTNDMTKMGSQGQDALNLFMSAHDKGEDIAAIAWMGYDAPSAAEGITAELGDIAGVTREDLAENGGHLLSDFVDGLRATYDGDSPTGQSHLTVIGHSYGSTTAAHAAADGLDEDSLVLIGSPGAGGGVHDVSGLHAPEGEVFVGSRENDFVTWLGGEISVDVPVRIGGDTVHLGNLGLGDDPSQAGFGAHRFDTSSDGTDTPFHLQDGGAILDRHTSYLDVDTASLENITNVVIDRDDQVDLVPGRDTPAHDRLYDFAGSEASYQAQQAVENYVVEPLEGVRDAVVDGAGRVVDGAGQVVDGVRSGAEDLGRRFSDAWPDSWP